MPDRAADCRDVFECPRPPRGATASRPCRRYILSDTEPVAPSAILSRTLRRRALTSDSIFYIASCTKTFVAAAIVLLISEGKIELDAPVKRYLPRFKLANHGDTESITVRDLLAHAKGIDSGPIVWLDAYTGEITEDRYYRWLRGVTPTGTHAYTNVHYTLLGRVVEAVTSQSWKDYLDERIFIPTGMTRSTCYASKMYGQDDAGIPSVRDGDGYTAATVRKTDQTMHAAGGMGASVKDLARWIRLNLNGGMIDDVRILPEKWMAEMHKMQHEGSQSLPRWTHRTRDGHGFAWNIGTYRGNLILEHGGGYVGTAASISFMPEKNIGVAVVANADGATGHFVMMDIYDRLLGITDKELLPRFKGYIEQRLVRTERAAKFRKPNPVEGDGLSLAPSAYVGDFANEDWGTIHVRLVRDRLVGKQGSLTLDFSTTGRDEFQMSYGTGDPDKGRFELQEGRVVTAIVMQLEGSAYRFERE